MASLPEVAIVALCAAEGCARLLKPILDFLANGMSPSSAAADAAIVAALLALVFAYLVCVFLVYLSVTTPSAVAAAVKLSIVTAFTLVFARPAIASVVVVVAGGGL
ncbi:Os06g0200000 [Oryza sativa Japonica Group]|jgi:hypothetical protein|uniref:Uncharacterized protein n=3 Tax=Oryza sativa TaxID=4530 RepID=Q69VW8_ORYSJ|nr:hypothetical protein OsI_22052 [Oryza sativa Indica Group]EAZ36159.1 hypothetical protein OsJ_20471 [Oryza sativa Japonica Group]KAF2925672.1 hypothetical protein DAI22_06g070000 [Oryza sativa Japonica Group]BAD35580.1 hypothetical protein [Oryza sativa Japonica Group]BAD36650.1 hypothetical protein [Oryza sativa Japonica Group]